MTSVRLDGKAAVVTGSGRGLGRAYAVALASAGAAVVVNDLDEASAAETVEMIASAGGRAVAENVAVGDAAAAEALVRRSVSDFGRLDVMVTNAGVLRDRVLWKLSDDDFDVVIKTHLRGTFTCARAAAIQMREQGEGGRIIVVGSISGQFASFGQSNYSAAKAGIVGLARTLAAELARDRITVNAIIPTAWTRMTATVPDLAPIAELVSAGRPIPSKARRDHALGPPEDCAPLVAFLASDEAAGITGQAIGIGGDRLAVYSHPSEVAVEYRDGGWTTEEIARIWADHLGEAIQRYTRDLPPLELEA